MPAEIRIDTEAVKTIAEDLKEEVSVLESYFHNIASVIERMGSYWSGDASLRNQEYFRSLQEDTEKLLSRLYEHPRDLLAMTGVYEGAETQSHEIAMSLPSDIIK